MAAIGVKFLPLAPGNCCEYCGAESDREPLEIATYETGSSRIRCQNAAGCDKREQVLADEERLIETRRAGPGWRFADDATPVPEDAIIHEPS